MVRNLELTRSRIEELINANTTMKMKSEFIYANTLKDYLCNVYKEEVLIRDLDTLLLAYDKEKAYAYIKDYDKFHYIECTKGNSEIHHSIYKQPVEKIIVNVADTDPLVIKSIDIQIRDEHLTIINSNNDTLFNKFISKL